MGDDDRPSFLDREKKSFAELDRMRREGGGRSETPRSPASRQRAKRATEETLQQADALFSADAEKERFDAVLEARGTPGLADACRAYLAAVGPPTATRLIGCFLDADDPDVVLSGLEAARAARAVSSLEVTPGLRTQLRILAEGLDDDLAEAAEALLEEL